MSIFPKTFLTRVFFALRDLSMRLFLWIRYFSPTHQTSKTTYRVRDLISIHPFGLDKSAYFRHWSLKMFLIRYLWALDIFDEMRDIASRPYMLPYAFESSRLDSTEHRFICLFCRNRLFALPNRDLTTLDSSERSSFIQTPRYIAESFVGIPFIEIACFFLPFFPFSR